MNNTLKVLDEAIQATLQKHPEEMFRTSVAIGISRKIQGNGPETYAKTFTSMNFARQKMLELNAEEVKNEIVKNAVKVVCLLARKKYHIALNKKQLEAGNYVIGEVACGKVLYGLQHGKSIDEILNADPSLLNILCESFVDARHVTHEEVSIEELDSKENIKYCDKYFKNLKQYC